MFSQNQGFPPMQNQQLGYALPNYSYPRTAYAKGGRTRPPKLSELIEFLRDAGQREDGILAHINPEEAMELKNRHGGDINPMTGLPQFGLWDIAGRGLAKAGLNRLDKGITSALPNVGSSIGSYFGGPIGGAIGSSIGNRVGQQFNQAGGLSSFAMPRLESRFGGSQPTMQPQAQPEQQQQTQVQPQVQSPAEKGQQQQGVNPMQFASNLWGDFGQGAVQRGLQNVDQRISNGLPSIGNSIGNSLGGSSGSQMGGGIGNELGSRFSQAGGLSSIVMPRLNSFFGPAGQQKMSVPQQAYARGGRAENPFEKGIDELRDAGQREDSVLAHINPEEAMELEEEHGGDINPMTGLPQFGNDRGSRKYGLFGPRSKRGGGERTETMFEQGARHHPILGMAGQLGAAGLGGYFGGPLGSILSSAGYGALEHGAKGVIPGALKGAAYGAIAPMAANMFGAEPGGFLGQASGLNSPSLMNQLGMESAPEMGGGLGLIANRLSNNQKNERVHELSGENGLFGGGDNESGLSALVKQLGGPVNAALLGTALIGTLGRREKMPKEASISEIMEANRPKFGPEDQYKKSKPFKLKKKNLPEGYRPGFHPEEQYFEDETPSLEYYREGGYLDGDSGGQDDDIDARLSPGEYIMDATTVSLLGDGNNRSGAKRFDEMRKEIRSHKGVKKFLPPKSKPVMSYLKSRKGAR